MSTAKTEFGTLTTVSALQESAEPTLCAISAQFLSRGLAVAVQTESKEQLEREEQTMRLQPAAYRLSKLSDAYISARYRHGKETMSGSDLIAYFSDTRALRTRNADFSLTGLMPAEGADEAETDRCSSAVRTIAVPSLRERVADIPKRIGTFPERMCETLKYAPAVWFQAEKPNTDREVRRFPLSAFAAIAAVAMSLMLIVASSVMLTQGEGRVNALKLELKQLTGEVSELKSDYSVQNDLLAIREIAVNEYGMVDREYLRMEYISMAGEDSIDVFEEEPQQGIGLSALLNALGILK